MKAPIFMDIPSKHALYLSKKIGPRYAGSNGEKLAHAYITRWLTDLDVDLRSETFRSHHSDIHGLILHGLLAIVAYALFLLNIWLSVFLSALVFVSLQSETYTWTLLSKFLPRTRSKNVIAVVPALGKTQNRVILVANYDSAKSSILFRPGVVKLYHLLYVVYFVSVSMVGIMSFLGLAAKLAGAERGALVKVWLGFSPFSVIIAVFTILLLVGELRGKPIAGANDNASGVGVMLSIIKAISTNRLENTEVWGVATSRNVAGARGMVSFLRKHRKETRDSVIINIDHVGRGEVKYLAKEGMLIGFHCNRKIASIARDVFREQDSTPLRKGSCYVKKSDALAALTRRRRALTIGGLNGKIPAGWRWHSDSYDLLNRMALDTSASTIYRLILRLDSRQ